MLPRTRTNVDRQITVKSLEIRVKFSQEQVVQALLDKYGDEAVGPEKYNIPPHSNNREVRWLNDIHDDENAVEFIWYENLHV